MVTQTALGRTARQAMLNAETDEVFGSSVAIHANRDAHHHRTLRHAEPLEDAGVDIRLRRNHLELAASHLKRRRVLEDRYGMVGTIVCARNRKDRCSHKFPPSQVERTAFPRAVLAEAFCIEVYIAGGAGRDDAGERTEDRGQRTKRPLSIWMQRLAVVHIMRDGPRLV